MLDNIDDTIKNDPIIQQYLETKPSKWKSLPLPSGIFKVLHRAGLLGPEISSTFAFNTTDTFIIQNKPYSTQKGRSIGNSYVEYSHLSQRHLGSIKSILQLPNNHLPTFVIHALDPLNNVDQDKSPYNDMPGILDSLVVYDAFGSHHVIECDQIIGHFVAVKNVEGTFGIDQRTLSCVCLGSWVSLLLILLVSSLKNTYAELSLLNTQGYVQREDEVESG